MITQYLTQYLLDTHALVHWQRRERMSENLSETLDEAARSGKSFVASVVFWELALLIKKGRLKIPDLRSWKQQILAVSGCQMIDPSAEEMVESVGLPDHHADPFDRLLVAMARRRNLTLVTADRLIKQYDVQTIWH